MKHRVSDFGRNDRHPMAFFFPSLLLSHHRPVVIRAGYDNVFIRRLHRQTAFNDKRISRAPLDRGVHFMCLTWRVTYS